MKTKAIFLSVLFMTLASVAWGSNMCIKNDTVMVVLDPQINGTELSSNVDGKTWSTEFPYGVVSGIGGCLAVNWNGVSRGTVATDQSITPYTEGKACGCFCKMLRPVTSLWVFGHSYNQSNGGCPDSSTSRCNNECALLCADRTGDSIDLRRGLFSTIGQSPSQQ